MSCRKKHKNRAVWKIFRDRISDISPPLTHITDCAASKAQHFLSSRIIASFADIFRLKRCHNAPRRVDLPHSSFSTNTWAFFSLHQDGKFECLLLSNITATSPEGCAGGVRLRGGAPDPSREIAYFSSFRRLYGPINPTQAATVLA